MLTIIIRRWNCLWFFVLLGGCAVGGGVSESKKDPSGKFDGVWVATVVSTAAVQPKPGNVIFTCKKRAGEKYFIEIKDSKVVLQRWRDSGHTYVNSNGKFKITVPWSSGGQGSLGLRYNNTNFNLVVSGSLLKQSGTMTIGREVRGNIGCDSKIRFVAG